MDRQTPRRSRGADPALERETNKIIKDDRRGRRDSVGVFVHTAAVILWDKVALSAYSESASWREIFSNLVLFTFSDNYVNKHRI